MLPKRERKSSKSDIDQQLSLDDNPVSTQDKITRKRNFIIIAIGSTAGLSLFFSLFSFFKNGQFSLPQFTPPAFNLPSHSSVSTPAFSSQEIFELIPGQKTDQWSIYIADQHSFTWSHNSSSPDFQQLASLPSSTYPTLPQGAKVQLQDNSTDQKVDLSLLITIPKNQISIAISATGSSDYLSQAKQALPAIISQIYWSVVQ